MPDPVRHFGFALPEITAGKTQEYVETVLDPQIEEVSQQLQLLQGVRRAIAGTFKIDRRDGVGIFGEAADRAKRAELEGDETTDAEGRMVPRRVEAAE